MKFELPVCRRCCGCIPLRRGILTFGYLNLLITLFFGCLQTTIWLGMHEDIRHRETLAMYRGVLFETHIILIMILHILDVVFNIILIFGAHKKDSRLLKWYYCYQLTTMIANFVIMLISYADVHKFYSWRTSRWCSEIAVSLLGFILQIYLLLLVHSELMKQKYKEGRSSYVNHSAEVFIEPPPRNDRRTLV